MKLLVTFLILILFSFVKSQESDKISVALVVDATASMVNEIQAVKNVCNRILSHFYNKKDSYIDNYILSVFRDPNVDRFVNTKNPTEIENVLKVTRAEAPGNFDCPEASMTGINEALKSALPNSLMFVFTDDEAKDVHLKQSVMSQLSAKQVKVLFMLTETSSSTCKIPKTYNTYKEIAEATGGMVIRLNEADIEATLKTFTPQFDEKFSPIDNKNYDAGSHKTKFEVSADDTELIIQTNAHDIIVYDPDRVIYNPKSIGGVYKYLNIQNPKPGTYEMDTKSHQSYSVLVGAISNIKFGYGFSMSQTNVKAKTLKQPIQGQKNYLMVYVSGTGELKKLDSVIFTFGGKTSKVDLLTVKDKKTYSTGLIEIPQEPFKITVSGEDSAGHKIYRVLSNSIKHSMPERKTALTPKDKEELDKVGKQMGLSKKILKSLKDANITADNLKHSLTDAEIEKALEGYDAGRYEVYKKRFRKLAGLE